MLGARRRAPGPQANDADAPAPILIVSASMGAGHDGAARGLAEQLRASGQPAEVRDFLTSGPLRIGFALRRGYEFELRHIPSAYDATYRFWYRAPWLRPALAWLVTILTRRRVMRWVRQSGARAVVSTYPLATLCLGRLRRLGRLVVPAVNFITDFGVHPLWVHPGVDLNLAVHSVPADTAGRLTGRPAVACGPAVSDRFDRRRLPDRDATRASLGLGTDDRAVLVVAGSWGVGNLRPTYEAIASAGRFVPVVVCGRDEGLRQELADLAATRGDRSIILGWTSEMPALMAACDALIENAGGLTSLEAMRAGVPVVSFDPIAGHGKENTSAMHAAGVALLAEDIPALHQALSEITEPGPARSGLIESAAAIFREAPAAPVLELASRGAETAQRPERERRAPVAVRLAASVTALAGLAWAGLTTGVAMATEAGAGVVRPAAHSTAVVYIGVRLSGAELADPAVAGELQAVGATAVVDDDTARSDPGALKALAAHGVSLASGGRGDRRGRPDGSPWSRAWWDARSGSSIAELAKVPVDLAVPGRRLTAWDLVECHHTHTALVVPDHVLRPSTWSAGPPRLSGGRVYVVNGLEATPQQLTVYLVMVHSALTDAGLASEPLALLA